MSRNFKQAKSRQIWQRTPSSSSLHVQYSIRSCFWLKESTFKSMQCASVQCLGVLFEAWSPNSWELHGIQVLLIANWIIHINKLTHAAQTFNTCDTWSSFELKLNFETILHEWWTNILGKGTSSKRSGADPNQRVCPILIYMHSWYIVQMKLLVISKHIIIIYIYIMLFGLIRQHFLNSSFTLLRCIERYSLLLYFSETRIILFRHLSSVRCWSSILGFLGILLCSARQDCNTATSGFGRSAIQTSVMCPLSALNFPALRPFLFGRPSYRWHSWQIFSILKTKSKGR